MPEPAPASGSFPKATPAQSSGRLQALRMLRRAAIGVVTGRPIVKRPPPAPPAEPEPGALQADVIAGLEGLDPAAGPPVALVTFPSGANPIQALLLGHARARGIAPVPMRSVEQLSELTELRKAGIAIALHLHWLDRVTRGAATEAEAAERIGDFLASLDAFRAAGGQLVWTVHNVIPHELTFEALEVELSGQVARRADVIHVMAARTAELVAPWYALPADRILHIPHPSYVGVYPEYVSRLDARHALGLRHDELVYLVLGSVHRYKGLADLLDAWAELPAGRRRLVIAGTAVEDAEVAGTIERATGDPSIVLRTQKIPVQDMQLYLRAADVAVLPYRGPALNSGVLLLALTFGLPVVVPADTGLADLVGPTFAVVFGGPNGPSLREALALAASLPSDAARTAARASIEAFDPDSISERFVTSLRARLDAAVPFRAPLSGDPSPDPAEQAPTHPPEASITA